MCLQELSHADVCMYYLFVLVTYNISIVTYIAKEHRPALKGLPG